MSAEEVKNVDTVKLELKPSLAAWLTLFLFILGGIIGFTRYADSKTSEAQVEKIVNDRIQVALAPIVAQVSQAVGNTEEIKKDLKELSNRK